MNDLSAVTNNALTLGILLFLLYYIYNAMPENKFKEALRNMMRFGDKDEKQ